MDAYTPSLEYQQIRATFALVDIDKREAEVRYGWVGAGAGDPDLMVVSTRDIGAGRELVMYEVENTPGDYTVHFEVYITTDEGVVIPGLDGETTYLGMSAPSIHGWA